MSEEWKKFLNDPRITCKYGAKCYQKNPDHHKKYKHPSKKRNQTADEPAKKRFKLDKAPTFLHKFKNDDNDSGESSTPGEKSLDERNIAIDLPKEIKYYNGVDDSNKILKDLFLVEMPEDFSKFYSLLIEDGDPNKILGSVNLELVGPYDLLLGKLPILENMELYLVHWRYFYDPPEFQTVLKRKGSSEYHIGYFRDAPNEMPVFLASNDSSKDCKISPMAYNIFGAVFQFLQNEKKKSPFMTLPCQKLMDKIKNLAADKFNLEEFDLKKRLSVSATKTFQGAGIVVPYNKKTQLGYRPLVETDAKIKNLFTQLENAKTQKDKDRILSELQPVITYANIAVDECDFGTGLELGINLLASGLKELESNAASILSSVYSLLNRDAFAKIIQAHLKYRRKGSNMSILAAST